MKAKKLIISIIIIIIASINFSYAQQSAEELAKQLSNPIASLYSVPFQFNFHFNINDREVSENGYRMLLNVQPVIPVALGKKINLINRVIMPFSFQRDVTGEDEEQNGLGDILYSGFISPAVSKVIWGAGPAISFPTATNDFLGTKKLAIGPSVVILGQPKKWTLGLLVNQLWTVAGNPDRPDMTTTYIQPFISYGFKGGMTLGVSSENLYEWKREQLQLGMATISISQIFKFGGKQLASIAFQPMIFYADARVKRPDWGARFNLVFLFPKSAAKPTNETPK